jgi:hypothetical protein
MGVSKVPFLKSGSGLEYLMGNWADQRIYSQFLIDNFSASSFFKSNRRFLNLLIIEIAGKMKEYQEAKTALARLNNEFEFLQKYKDSLMNLDLLVLIKF